MHETITFTKNVPLAPEYYDENIDAHILTVLKSDIEGRIYNGYLVIEVLSLRTKDLFRHHYIMDGVAHFVVTFQCLTESLYEGEIIQMTKIECNTVGSFWRTKEGSLKSFILGSDDTKIIGEDALVQITAKSDNSFTIGVLV